MKSLVFTLLAFLVTWQTAQAEVSMPKFFSDNMVLQRERPIRIWGRAANGESVTVRFAGSEVSVQALPLETVQVHAFAADRVHREERGAAAVAPLEHLDGRLAAVFIFHNDVLHRRAKGRLNGGRKFVVHADQLRHRAAHAAQVSALSVLHHEAHRLGKALKFPLHLAQHLHPRLDGLELDA